MTCCAEYFIKYILFTFNLIFTLGGLVLLILGIVVQVAVSEVAVGNGYLPSIASIVVGSIIFVIAFFGCCGAIRENRCFLLVYAILMIVLMIVKIIVGTVIFLELDDLLLEVVEWLSETFTNDRALFLDVQSSFNCCGTTGFEVYLPGALPASCCVSAPCNVNNVFGGCNDIVPDYINTYWIAIGVIVFVIAGVELVAGIFGFCLSTHIANKQTVQVVDSS